MCYDINGELGIKRIELYGKYMHSGVVYFAELHKKNQEVTECTRYNPEYLVLPSMMNYSFTSSCHKCTKAPV